MHLLWNMYNPKLEHGTNLWTTESEGQSVMKNSCMTSGTLIQHKVPHSHIAIVYGISLVKSALPRQWASHQPTRLTYCNWNCHAMQSLVNVQVFGSAGRRITCCAVGDFQSIHRTYSHFLALVSGSAAVLREWPMEPKKPKEASSNSERWKQRLLLGFGSVGSAIANDVHRQEYPRQTNHLGFHFGNTLVSILVALPNIPYMNDLVLMCGSCDSRGVDSCWPGREPRSPILFLLLSSLLPWSFSEIKTRPGTSDGDSWLLGARLIDSYPENVERFLSRKCWEKFIQKMLRETWRN